MKNKTSGKSYTEMAPKLRPYLFNSIWKHHVWLCSDEGRTNAMIKLLAQVAEENHEADLASFCHAMHGMDNHYRERSMIFDSCDWPHPSGGPDLTEEVRQGKSFQEFETFLSGDPKCADKPQEETIHV